MWAALCVRKQQAVQDDFAKQGVFYLSVFSGAYLEAWGCIYKYETKKNRTSPFCPQDYIFPSYLTRWISFLGGTAVVTESPYLVTNSVTLSCRWTEPLTKLESSEAPLALSEIRRGVPIFCPYISLENCSYGLLWLWSCHLAALHCWIFVEFFWWTLPSEFKTSNQSKLISSWIVSKPGHPQSYQNCAFMNFVSTPWIYWLLLCSQ